MLLIVQEKALQHNHSPKLREIVFYLLFKHLSLYVEEQISLYPYIKTESAIKQHANQ